MLQLSHKHTYSLITLRTPLPELYNCTAIVLDTSSLDYSLFSMTTSYDLFYFYKWESREWQYVSAMDNYTYCVTWTFRSVVCCSCGKDSHFFSWFGGAARNFSIFSRRLESSGRFWRCFFFLQAIIVLCVTELFDNIWFVLMLLCYLTTSGFTTRYIHGFLASTCSENEINTKFCMCISRLSWVLITHILGNEKLVSGTITMVVIELNTWWFHSVSDI